MSFSVCTVAYGEYPAILKKTLDSIVNSPKADHVRDLRIGLNAVCPETFDYVMDLCGSRLPGIPCYVFQSDTNVGKYPLMRRMLRYTPAGKAPYVMWFDDDSYLDEAVGLDWWVEVERIMQQQVTLLGAVHSIRQRGSQYEGIRDQPWFTGKPVSSKHRFKFVTGGWWVANYEFLLQHGYPFLEVYHNGGDSILGELLRQQDKSMQSFLRVKCHCESCIKRNRDRPEPAGVVHINVGGRRGRRGLGRSNEIYPWQNYDRVSQDYRHQFFDLKIYRFNPEVRHSGV